MDCDVLIVGGGAAGCTAACKLAKKYDVCLVTSRTPATAMSTGRILITDDNDPQSSELTKFLKSIGNEYGLFINQEETISLTNKGTEYNQSFISRHDYLMDVGAVAGIKGNNDLNPELFAKMARKHGINIDPYWLNDELEESLVEIPDDTIIIPPIFNLRDYHKLMDLEKKCGRRLQEAVTPLSLPGKRFSECLLSSAEKAGAKIFLDRELIEINNNAALVASGLREQIITYNTLLLAGGNVVSGGLELDGNSVREPLLGLAVSEASGKKLNSASLTDALSAGICIHGPRASAGIYACGSIVAGISHPLNRGLWDVMLSALNAAQMIAEDI